MSQIFRVYAPNPKVANCAPATTNWQIVAEDGTTYNTLALLLAALKRPYPGLFRGAKLESCLMRTISAAGAAGAAALYKRDTTTTPSAISDADGELGGSDQQIGLECPFQILWVKLTTSTDRLLLDGRY